MMFAPYTHVAIGNDVVNDVLDDGMVTIEGNDYPVHTDIVEALRDHKAFYNAGVVGPDGFPDLTMGQAVIHPEDTGLWLKYVYEKAWRAQGSQNYTDEEKSEILAWSYGFLTHAAGDVWAHTFVNEFADGVFPPFSELPTDRDKAAIALRHMIVEGYIADATPGFDGQGQPTTIVDANNIVDYTDDSTPGIEFDAPHEFIYNTLISATANTPSRERGPLIDYFTGLRGKLERGLDDIPFLLEPFVRPYMENWIDDIDEGLREWSHFGLDVTKALFDPQTRRDAQNDICRNWGPPNGGARLNDCEYRIGRSDVLSHQTNEFVNDHLLSMLGAPDFVGGLRGLLQSAVDFLDDIIGPAGNPVRIVLADISDLAHSIINDAIAVTFNIDLDQMDAMLHRPSSKMGIRSVDLGTLGTIDLFDAGDQAKIDAYLGISGSSHELFQPDDVVDGATYHPGAMGALNINATFNPDTFRAYRNSVTMSKLLLLDGATMDNVIRDLTQISTYTLYADDDPGFTVYTHNNLVHQVGGNIMTTAFPGIHAPDRAIEQYWLYSIDGDHAWRDDGHADNHSGVQASGVHSGNGNFPLWESYLLRQNVFRRLFRDWQNGTVDDWSDATTNFPETYLEHRDGTSYDANESAPRAELVDNVLYVSGTGVSDSLTVERTSTSIFGATLYGTRVSWAATPYYSSGIRDFPFDTPQLVVATGGAGDDVIVIHSDVSSKAEIYGDTGNDILQNGSGSGYLSGGSGNDTLYGGPRPDQLLGGIGDDMLAGGDGDDSYLFYGGYLGRDTISDTGNGDQNEIDFRHFSGPITVDLNSYAPQTIHPQHLQLTLTHAWNVNNVIGSSFDDHITGNDQPNTIMGRDGNDIIEGGAGFDRLNGGSGDDRYVFAGNSLGDDEIEESPGQGVDVLDFSAFTSSVNIDLGLTTPQMVSTGSSTTNSWPYLTVQLSSERGIEGVIGGTASDQIFGNERPNRLYGGPGDDILEGRWGNDHLSGDAGSDMYRFDGELLGTDFISEAPNQDVDTLDVSGVPADVTVDLSTTATQTIADNLLSLTLSSSLGVENVIAGTGNDLITGNGRNNWLRTGDGDDRLMASVGDDVLEGGNGSDTYIFDVEWLGDDVIQEVANRDSDTIDLSMSTTPVNIDLSDTRSQQVVGARSLSTPPNGPFPGFPTLTQTFPTITLSNAVAVENVVGSPYDDRLIGNDRDNRLTGLAGRDWLDGASGDDQVEGGSEDDWLAGGLGDDTYVFDGKDLGSDTIDERANADSDTLDLSQMSQGIAIDLSLVGWQSVVSHQLDIQLTEATGVENVLGTRLDDRIFGNDRPNRLSGSYGNDTLEGRGGDDYLSGGDHDDTYIFAGGGLGQDVIEEDANAGSDVLDFHLFIGPIQIDIGSITLQHVGRSELSIQLIDVNGIDHVIGSEYDDYIRGNALTNRMLGGAGNDTLLGGDAVDYLFGEDGEDNLDGGSDGWIDELYGGRDADVFQGDVQEFQDFVLGTDIDVLFPV